MPRRIEPSRSALADFDAIYDYIARDNPRARLKRFAHSIIRSTYWPTSQNWERSFATDGSG
jgi:plasmid stabilization system protein ParE